MNWSNIAVYTCPDCDHEREAYCVMQSDDGAEIEERMLMQKQRVAPTDPVVIAEGTQFKEDEDEDELCCGGNDVDDDEDW